MPIKRFYVVVFYAKIESNGKVKSLQLSTSLDLYQAAGGLANGII